MPTFLLLTLQCLSPNSVKWSMRCISERTRAKYLSHWSLSTIWVLNKDKMVSSGNMHRLTWWQLLCIWDFRKNQFNEPQTYNKQQVGFFLPSVDLTNCKPLRKSLTWSWMGWMIFLINQRLWENNQTGLSLLESQEHCRSPEKWDNTGCSFLYISRLWKWPSAIGPRSIQCKHNL